MFAKSSGRHMRIVKHLLREHLLCVTWGVFSGRAQRPARRRDVVEVFVSYFRRRLRRRRRESFSTSCLRKHQKCIRIAQSHQQAALRNPQQAPRMRWGLNSLPFRRRTVPPRCHMKRGLRDESSFHSSLGGPRREVMLPRLPRHAQRTTINDSVAAIEPTRCLMLGWRQPPSPPARSACPRGPEA